MWAILLKPFRLFLTNKNEKNKKNKQTTGLHDEYYQWLQTLRKCPHTVFLNLSYHMMLNGTRTIEKMSIQCKAIKTFTLNRNTLI